MNPLQTPWKSIGIDLHPLLIETLCSKLGFETVMPVQKAVVPLLSKNYDVAVESCTGSGKTLAFLVPILNNLLNQAIALAQRQNSFSQNHNRKLEGAKCLILTPTRELAIQIHNIAYSITQGLKDLTGIELTTQLAIGGERRDKEQSGSQSLANLLVATPGRLRELLYQEQDKKTNLSSLEFLILDEADRLIEGNHRFDVKDILSKIPKQRRTGLFSATLNNVEIEKLIKLGLRNPAKVRIKTSAISGENSKKEKEDDKTFSVPLRLENCFFLFENRLEKILFLFNLLTQKGQEKIIIFFNTCYSVDFYSKLFKAALPKISLMKLHGQMNQTKRTKIFSAFGEAKTGALITTDLIARGVDFEGISAIYQVDPPQNPEFFIHRIGRTARGVAAGEAYLLLEKGEYGFFEYLTCKGLYLEQKITEGLDFEIEDQFKKIMLTDKDFLIKSKKAFISFLRSYKEHLLQDTFKLETLDISQIGRSFFLPIIPKVKEIEKIKIKRVIDENYWEQAQQVVFLDENQEKQFKAKEASLLVKRENLSKRKEFLRRKAEKEQLKKKKRSYSDRKHAKEKEEQREFEEFAKENLLAKKLKKGQITKKEYEKEIERLDRKFGNVSNF